MLKQNKFLLSKPSFYKIKDGAWEQKLLSKQIILYNCFPGQISFYGLDSYDELLKASQYDGKSHFYCENSTFSDMICPYVDIDIYQKDEYDILHDINQINNSINLHFPYLLAKFFIKYCHGPTNHSKGSYKHSFHLIIRLFYNNSPVYLQNCKQALEFSNLLKIPADPDAYKNNLRLLYSNKCNKNGSFENRIFQIHPLSDFQNNPKMSLMSYCPHSEDDYYMLGELITKQYMISTVRSLGYQKEYKVTDILFETINDSDCYCFYLTEQKCPERSHKSNNSSAMYFIDSNTFIIKCLDQECQASQTFRLSFNNFQITDFDDQQSRVSTKSRNTSSSSQSTQNSQLQQLQSCSNLIQQFIGCSTAHRVSSIDKLYNCGFEAIGAPSKSKALQTILGNKSRKFVANNNKMTYDLNGNSIDDDLWQILIDELKLIVREETKQTLKQQNIITNNIVNIGSININQTKDSKDDVVYDNEFENIEFKSDKHRKFFINIFNNEIQFITKLYNLDFPGEFLYVYDDKDCGQVMFFDNYDEEIQTETNGGFWNMQGGFQIAKQKIRDYTVEFFNQVINQLDPKDKKKKLIQFRLNNIRNDIYNNSRFDQYLMETYLNRKIKFNNHPNYLHFQNGTFDLDQNKFIKTTPNMYNTFQIDYDYDPSVKYDEMYEQLSQIMQPDEFEWLLKQLSNCLNPTRVIEEKQLVVLIGFGDNGKTILCKLMTHVLGTQAYAYNGRHHMVQTPNTSSSNATPDFAKLLNKRFCYIAELDKKIGFNQQQVKILTGGEEIQARDLYKSLITFQPCAGMFISCNQIPYIDTSDGGFLNRLKIIDLKYSFVEKPTNKFQKPTNKQLQSLIKSTYWKQGFMNMMIQYYYKKQIKIPKTILASIKSRVSVQQNPITQWVSERLQFSEGKYVMAEQIWQQYLDDTNNKVTKISFNRQVQEFFLQHPSDFNGISYDLIDIRNKDEKIKKKGFYNCSYKENIEQSD